MKLSENPEMLNKGGHLGYEWSLRLHRLLVTMVKVAEPRTTEEGVDLRIDEHAAGVLWRSCSRACGGCRLRQTGAQTPGHCEPRPLPATGSVYSSVHGAKAGDKKTQTHARVA